MSMGMSVGTPDGATSFTCNNCGATTSFVAAGVSIVCPFCGSQYVISKPDDPNRPRPEALLPFNVPDTQVQTTYHEWLGKGFFRPRDLNMLATNHKMRAVYLPFWECHGYATSDWTAMAGYNYEVEEQYQDTDDGQTVTKTRTITRTDWRPASGHHEDNYPRELVSGSRGLPQDWIAKLGDFDFGQLQAYNPQFLVGREAEEPATDKVAALQVAQQQIVQKEQQACSNLVPGDTQRDLRVQTLVSNLDAQLLYLPIWLASFQYKDKLYRCVVNGQTGKIGGEAPVSKAKVWLVVIAAILAIVLIVILVSFISSHTGHAAPTRR